MIRLLFFLCFLALAAFGLSWFLDRPGDIVLTWQDYRIETSVAVGLGLIIVLAIALAVLWAIIRTIFKLPSLMSMAARQRKRGKGYAALSRGMIAAGSGDVRLARKSAAEATRHIPDEPLALLLKAQAAQLAGDRAATDAAFTDMVQRPATRLLGLRGLHVEAQRRGDMEAAHYFAQEAHKIAPLAWSGKAVLDHRAAQGEWRKALATLESNIAAKLVDKKTGERQKAVLETALAIEAETTSPEEALRLSRLAAGREPSLVPAVALAARLLSRKGDIRKAAKLIETAWMKNPHPDLADVYLDLRQGDSNADRLARANMLLRLTPRDPESRMAVARAAMAAREFAVARTAMKPLIADGEQPSVRMCLIMADLEDAEHGALGDVRAWLARASRAPRDAVWMADGIAAEAWAPASPVTGKLDAFVWQRPPERPGLAIPLHPIEDEEPQEIPALTHDTAAHDSVEQLVFVEAPAAPNALQEADSLHPQLAPEPLPAAATATPAATAAKPVVFAQPEAPDDPGAPDGAEPAGERLPYPFGWKK
jgi:HemY protein